MNFAQADKIMTQLQLDALVLGDGLNFQHAIGVRPVISRMGRPPSAFAIVKRGERERLAIVSSAFSYYYTLADTLKASDIPVYLYTAPGRDLHEGGPEAAPLILFSDRGESPVDAIETARVAATRNAVAGQGEHATMEGALARALKDLGLSRARIAVDHRHAEGMVARAAPQATVTDAEDALRRIRPVKSAVEIQLMRQAAQANVDAALEALTTIRAGGSYRDLRAEFFIAAARRGHRGVFMVVDRVSDELYDNTFSEGQALLIDCVSEYQGYHGDYGRTVFVGEPARPMIAATRAIGNAWDDVRENLRPGLRFSDISAMGQAALRRSGQRYLVPFNPHSVGLYHSDHVGPSGLPPREDIVLEPGMVLSIDCPLLETGVGGSAHLEDLMLITPDGAEPINATDQQTITV
jgi:Xaa-Pro aminopeptidase